MGYGAGEIEIVDQALVERFGRQRSGSELLAVEGWRRERGTDRPEHGVGITLGVRW